MVSIHDFTVPKVSEESPNQSKKLKLLCMDASNH